LSEYLFSVFEVEDLTKQGFEGIIP
jgi:hypothetical protein